MVLHRVGQATHLLTGVVTDAKPNGCASGERIPYKFLKNHVERIVDRHEESPGGIQARFG